MNQWKTFGMLQVADCDHDSKFSDRGCGKQRILNVKCQKSRHIFFVIFGLT